MDPVDDGIYAGLLRRGISRRSFITFSAAMAATLALPVTYGPRIASAIEAAPRIPLVWLRGQACGGDSQALLQATDPTVGDLLVEMLSVDYLDLLMAASGEAADPTRLAGEGSPGYIAVVEGSIPSRDGGMSCVVDGRPFSEVVRDVCSTALATIAVGSCAVDGGVSAASGGTSGSSGVGGYVPGGRLVNLPGCPVNGDNLAATLAHYVTFKALPPTDRAGRPLFAYGSLIHNQCERRAHFEFGEFVLAWGDEAAQKGWCLYKLGCKGPEAFANCPTVRYADGRSWAVQAGHGCIGCTTPSFWDAMGPAYARLPGPLPFAPNVTVDQIGAAALAGIAGVAVVHGAASWVRGRRSDPHGRPHQPAAAVAVPAAAVAVPAAAMPMATPDRAAPDEAAPDEIATDTAAAPEPPAAEPPAARPTSPPDPGDVP